MQFLGHVFNKGQGCSCSVGIWLSWALWFLLLGAFFCEKKLWMFLGCFLYLLPSTPWARRSAGSCYARKGRGDERLAVYVAGGRAWSCYKYRGLSLCRRALLWLGLANGSPGCWVSVFARCLTGVVNWSVLESLVRGVLCPLTQLRWGRGRCTRVMGAYCAACPQRRCNHLSHNCVGVVGGAFRCGFSERWRGYLVGRIEPCGGGGLRCCFGMLRVQIG
jgi:hypothetical protein